MIQRQTSQGEFYSQESDASLKEPWLSERSKGKGQSLCKTPSVRRREGLKKRQRTGRSERQEET